MRILPALFLATLALGFAAAHAADVYRWTDDKGVTHFSDAPPTDTQYQRMNVRSGTTSVVDDTTPATTDQDAAAPVTADQGKAERCRIARQNLETLDSGMAAVPGDDGQPRALTEAELTQQRELNERAVARNCQDG